MTQSRREARRKRDREDFIRATTQAVRDSGNKLPLGTSKPGATAGPTYREHLERRLEEMVQKYKRLQATGDDDKARTARGIIRGLAMSLALYENSYDSSIDHIKRVEEDFL